MDRALTPHERALLVQDHAARALRQAQARRAAAERAERIAAAARAAADKAYERLRELEAELQARGKTDR